jgi:hypothetical protein
MCALRICSAILVSAGALASHGTNRRIFIGEFNYGGEGRLKPQAF